MRVIPYNGQDNNEQVQMMLENENYEEDGLSSIIDSYEGKIDSIESSAKKLLSIADSVEKHGMSRATAASLESLDDKVLGDRSPNHYTQMSSAHLQQESMESIWHRAGEMIKVALEYILELMNKFVEWVSGRDDKIDLTDTYKKENKSFAVVNTKYTKRVETLEHNYSGDQSQYSARITKLEQVKDAMHPTLVENDSAIRSTYSVLVKSALNDPRGVGKLLSYADKFPIINSTFKAVANVATQAAENIIEDSGLESLRLELSKAANVREEFNDAVSDILRQFARNTVGSLRLPRPSSEDEGESYRHVRRIREYLLEQYNTPSGTTLMDDFDHRIEDIERARLELADVLQEAREKMSKYDDEIKKLKATFKDLSKVTERLKATQFDTETQGNVRRLLVEINREIRQIVLGILYLREIPDIINRAVRRNFAQEALLKNKQVSLLKE